MIIQDRVPVSLACKIFDEVRLMMINYGQEYSNVDDIDILNCVMICASNFMLERIGEEQFDTYLSKLCDKCLRKDI